MRTELIQKKYYYFEEITLLLLLIISISFVIGKILQLLRVFAPIGFAHFAARERNRGKMAGGTKWKVYAGRSAFEERWWIRCAVHPQGNRFKPFKFGTPEKRKRKKRKEKKGTRVLRRSEQARRDGAVATYTYTTSVSGDVLYALAKRLGGGIGSRFARKYIAHGRGKSV